MVETADLVVVSLDVSSPRRAFVTDRRARRRQLSSNQPCCRAVSVIGSCGWRWVFCVLAASSDFRDGNHHLLAMLPTGSELVVGELIEHRKQHRRVRASADQRGRKLSTRTVSHLRHRVDLGSATARASIRHVPVNLAARIPVGPVIR